VEFTAMALADNQNNNFITIFLKKREIFMEIQTLNLQLENGYINEDHRLNFSSLL